jgi:hypothetical protein
LTILLVSYQFIHLVHFSLEQRKLYWRGIIFDQSRNFFSLISAQLSGAERPKFSISPMPATVALWFDLILVCPLYTANSCLHQKMWTLLLAQGAIMPPIPESLAKSGYLIEADDKKRFSIGNPFYAFSLSDPHHY